MFARREDKVLYLSMEKLESRQMLSTVTIFAAGEMGDEQMQLLELDDLSGNYQVVKTWNNVGGDATNGVFNSFTYESTSANSEIREFAIRFGNDLYQPDQGIDRNLRVDRIFLDGNSYEAEGYSVFSTGTWKAEDGIAAGFRRSEFLHSNGEFFFDGSELSEFSTFDRTWFANGNSTYTRDDVFFDLEEGDLWISGSRGVVSLYTPLAFVAGSDSRLTFDAKRVLEKGLFDNEGKPWVTVGIDFYDASGIKVGAQAIDVNIPFEGNEFQTASLDFTAPGTATTAFAWIWHQGTTDGRSLPVVIRNFQFQSNLNNVDSVPATISLQPLTVTESDFTVNFGVEIRDNNPLPSNPLIPFGVRVTGPNSYDELAEIATGIPTGSPNFQNLILTIFSPSTSGSDRWTSADNGTYSVSLLPNSLIDVAGNYTPAQTFGTFDINIADLPADVSPPTITLNPVTVLTNRSAIHQFSVVIVDDQDPFPTVSGLRIVRPNGTSAEITAVAGGSGTTPDSTYVYEVFWFNSDLIKVSDSSGPTTWGPEHNGLYRIYLDANKLVDVSGNATPAQLLGTFEVRIV